VTTLAVVGAKDWYRTQRMADGVTLIDEPHIKPFFRCNMWHIRGGDRDLLLDTGLGHFSLRRHVALVSEKPVVCVASHSHFDHIGCHHEFADRRIHVAEADILARPDRARTLAARYADEGMFESLPEGWKTASYEIPPAPATALLSDYDASMARLERLPVEIVHGGHCPSFGRARLKELIREYREGRRQAGCHLAAKTPITSGRE
jgi:glyoxylase-like metal-dependent hydrolase (beta-lactamase superfamily II)